MHIHCIFVALAASFRHRRLDQVRLPVQVSEQRPIWQSSMLQMMMSPVAVSYIVGKMLFSETFGPINDFLSFWGLPLFNWSLSPFKSMALLIVIDTWQWTPFFILILLAGLQSIPEELFEAAKIDGASSFQILWESGSTQ